MEIICEKEIDASERNKTWALVKFPQDRKVFSSKWVYKLNKEC
jgi:hypothetical protein